LLLSIALPLFSLGQKNKQNKTDVRVGNESLLPDIGEGSRKKNK
jgi:hypothetical protein